MFEILIWYFDGGFERVTGFRSPLVAEREVGRLLGKASHEIRRILIEEYVD